MPMTHELSPLHAVARATNNFPQLPDRVWDVALEEAQRERVTVRMMQADGWAAPVVRARRRTWVRLRQMTGTNGRPLSFIRISMWFRCHWSTVVYGVRVELGLIPRKTYKPRKAADGSRANG